MKLGVLAVPDSWYLKDLRRAASGRHEVVGLSFANMVAQAGELPAAISAAESSLATFDALLVRTMPPGSLEQVVFRMDALGQLNAAGVVIINSPRCLETAIDKYLSTAKLTACGLPSPRTIVCQGVDEAMLAWESLGGNVVIKPLFGGEGRGITRISDRDLAHRAFKLLAQMQAVIYMQEFIEHKGFDLRLLVLGERVFGMQRINPHDWRTNVSRGATTQPLEPDAPLTAMARAAAQAVGAWVAGVDILPARDGRWYVLEVNAVPGWKALSRTLGVDIAALLLTELEALTNSR